MNDQQDTNLEERLRQIADERERLDREQEGLREEAEKEIRKIDPMIEEIRKEISDKERAIEALKAKQLTIEDFLQKLSTRSHPLRRAAVA